MSRVNGNESFVVKANVLLTEHQRLAALSCCHSWLSRSQLSQSYLMHEGEIQHLPKPRYVVRALSCKDATKITIRDIHWTEILKITLLSRIMHLAPAKAGISARMSCASRCIGDHLNLPYHIDSYNVILVFIYDYLD